MITRKLKKPRHTSNYGYPSLLGQDMNRPARKTWLFVDSFRYEILILFVKVKIYQHSILRNSLNICEANTFLPLLKI